MNPRLKQFLAIFFFIWGVVGIVLAVANGMQEPKETTAALLFGAVGVIGFAAGSVLIRRPRY